MWLHVDGAMSGIAALAPEHRWVNDGLGLADSYCTNAHKWMGVNFDCDLFWTADRGALLGALSILPEYLRSAAAESGAAIDYRDWQIPLGRRFRALKLWMTLRLDGVEPIRAMIRRHVELTDRLAAEVGKDERFEIVAEPPLNLLVLRLVGDDADARTDALIERGQRDRHGAVHAHRPRRARRAAVLDRRHGHDVGRRRGRVAAPAAARRGLTGRPPARQRGAAAIRVSRSTSMNAVAPHTVSSSSSKKCRRRSVGLRPQRSEW